MIHNKTIDAVHDIRVHEVVTRFGVKLDKKGTNWWGLCPFHTEKSPSFSANDNLYKCFGCGEGGGGVSFIMKYKRLAYPDAITAIAETFGITVEFDNSEEGKKTMERHKRVQQIADLNALAMRWFVRNASLKLEQLPAITERWPDFKELATKWEMGWGGTEWSALADHLKEQGANMDEAVNMGLVYKKEKGDGYVDAYRNRVVFAIRDDRGRLVAFGGRYMGDHDADKTAKYINGKETDAYKKKSVLYGLFDAKASVGKSGRAYLTEGYTDVHGMVKMGKENTVATCGTAFTDGHAKLLNDNGCTHLIIAYDGDNAGRTAAEKSVHVAMRHGITCSFMFFPENEDPDSFQRKHGSLDATHEVPDTIQLEPGEERMITVPILREVDAMESLINMAWLQVKTSSDRVKAEAATVELLACVKSDIIRKVYADYAKKTWKCSSDIFRGATKRNSEVATDDDEDDYDKPVTLPRGVDKQAISDYGIAMVEEKGKIGIYVKKDKQVFSVSNFTIQPLFHIYSNDRQSNRRICLINNGVDKYMIEADANAFISTSEFERVMLEQGNFLFEGDKITLTRLKGFLMHRFPRAAEITRLGWQRGNFWAYANAIYIPGKPLVKADNQGLVKINNEFFFLPAYSDLYAHIQEGDADPYVEDRYLRYEAGEVDFAAYADTFFQVFGTERSAWGLGWAIMCAFRDHVFRSLGNYFPHLYAYGETQGGKSTFCFSIVDIWFRSRGPFNLGEGSEAGFGALLENITNAPAWFDEMSNDTRETLFQMLKGAADGSGRIKRSMNSTRKKNERDQVNSSPLISGQYFTMRDDGALGNRCIALEFKKVKPTPEQRATFIRLEAMRKAGLGRVLCEILSCRQDMVDGFMLRYHELSGLMRERLTSKQLPYTERVLQGMMAVVATVDIVRDTLKFPLDHEAMMLLAEEKISGTSAIMHDTNALATFWRILEQQYHHVVGKDNDGKVIRGMNPDTDFVIISHYSGDKVTIQKPSGGTDTHKFEQSTEVLYIRLTNIHGIYLKEHKQQFNARGLSDGDLRGYLKSYPGYIGNVMNVWFDGKRTTAMGFDINMLPAELSLGYQRKMSGNDGIIMPNPADTDESQPQPQSEPPHTPFPTVTPLPQQGIDFSKTMDDGDDLPF